MRNKFISSQTKFFSVIKEIRETEVNYCRVLYVDFSRRLTMRWFFGQQRERLIATLDIPYDVEVAEIIPFHKDLDKKIVRGTKLRIVE